MTDSLIWGLSNEALVAIITALSGVAAIFWGIYQYRNGQITNRQEVLFAHIKELNESKELILAKKLIAYKKVPKPNAAYDDPDYYSIDQLKFLKDPKEALEHPEELEIKDSLDSFIVFLGKVGYSLEVGAIKRNEIVYFQYWIHKTLENKKVQDYIRLPGNQFPLYQMLLRDLLKNRILSRLSKWYSYQKEWQTPLEEPQLKKLKKKLAPTSPSVSDAAPGREAQ